MNAEFRRILIVGEHKDKIEFIKEFLFGYAPVQLEELFRKKEKNDNVCIQLKHCFDYHCRINYDKENIMIESFHFPAGIILEADMNPEQQWLDSPLASSCGMVLFLLSYPWKTAGFLENLHRIPEHLGNNTFCYPVQYCAVMWINPNQHFGATDLINPEKIIEELPYEINKTLKQSSETAFLASVLEYPVFRDYHDFWKILSVSGKMQTFLEEEARINLEKLHQKIEEFPSEYFSKHPDYLGLYLYDFPLDLQEKFENLTNQETFRQLTSFSAVRGSGNIIQRYRDNYYRQYADIIYRAASEIYQLNIQDICFWDLEKDIKQLYAEIENSYQKLFKNEKATACPDTQREYQNILHNNKYDIHFIEETICFIQDGMMRVIYEHILKKEKTLSSILYSKTSGGGNKA